MVKQNTSGAMGQMAPAMVAKAEQQQGNASAAMGQMAPAAMTAKAQQQQMAVAAMAAKRRRGGTRKRAI
jgi:hypothetical protein